MTRIPATTALAAMILLSSCAKKESADAPAAAQDTTAAAQPAAGPHASVRLQDGSRVPGTIVASTPTEVIVAGDDGIERKIPVAQVKAIEYGPAQPPRQASRPPAAPPAPSGKPAEAAASPAPPAVTTKTYELAVGSDVSVRTNEAIDSGTAQEGQTFDVQVTRDVKDPDGDVVIPRGSDGKVVIKSASKGGRFRGASDLLLDLQSVSIGGRLHTIETSEIGKKGKSGIGANKRTAEYTGGGAALGAIIGAIAGGGKGAAIGAGAGAGAGALTQIITKGGSIKVPVETVLTFTLDKPLRVTAAQ